MKSYYFLVLFLFVLSPCFVYGQTTQVWLYGKVVKDDTNKPIPLAQIASFKKVELYAADSIGEFKIILDADDRIKVVALGFEARTFYLDSLKVDASEMYLFPLKRTSYQIEQVDINSSHHYSNYWDKMKAMRSKQMGMDLNLPSNIELGRKPDVPVDILPTYRKKPPVIAWVKQPFNVLYYYTAKSEKQKRKMMKLLKYEKQRQMLTIDLIQKVSGYKGDELDNFVMYCNANIKFNNEDTPLSIKYKVVDLFKAYQSNNND